MVFEVREFMLRNAQSASRNAIGLVLVVQVEELRHTSAYGTTVLPWRALNNAMAVAFTFTAIVCDTRLDTTPEQIGGLGLIA